MRILLAGSDADGGLGFTTGAVRRALERAGHVVELFDYRTRRLLPGRRFDLLFRGVRRLARAGRLRRRLVGAQDAVMARALRARVAASPPGLVLVLKGERVAPALLASLRRTWGVPIANWFVDPVVDAAALVEAMAPAYDFFFTIDDLAPDAAARIKAGRVVHLPTACEPEVHRPVPIDEAQHARFACDVCFVGRFGRRAQAFHGLTDLALHLWGTRLFDDALRPFLRGEGLWGDDLARQYAAARIVLNVHASWDRPEAEQAMRNVNPRLFEIPACGGFQLTDNRANATRFFVEGTEVACYASAEELRDTVRHYLPRDDERRRMAARAGDIARRLHTYDRRMATLLDTVARG